MAIFSIDQIIGPPNDPPKPEINLIEPSIDYMRMLRIPFHPTHVTLQVSADKATFVKFSPKMMKTKPVFFCPVNGSFSSRPTRELAPINMSSLGWMRSRSSWRHEELFCWVVAQNMYMDREKQHEVLKDIEAFFTIECMVSRWEAIFDRIGLRYTYCEILNDLVYIFKDGDPVALRFV